MSIKTKHIDVGAGLASAILRSTCHAGFHAIIEAQEGTDWQTATFTGTRQTLTIRAPQSAALDKWLAALPAADIQVEGHLIADIVADSARPDCESKVFCLRVLTVEDTPRPADEPPPTGGASPEMLAAFEAWKLAELASHYTSPCPDEVMDALVEQAGEKLEALHAAPVQSADDLLLKLFPSLVALFEPPAGAAPLCPAVGEYHGSYIADGHAAMMRDIGRLIPALAEAMAVPHPNTARAKS